MAQVFLEPTDTSFNVNDPNTRVFGASGNQTINGFGDDDTIEIVGAPAGSELQLASSSADSLDFVYGATDFSNVWGVTLGQLDAALVTDVVAAPDLAAQVGVLDTAWNEWLLGA